MYNRITSNVIRWHSDKSAGALRQVLYQIETDGTKKRILPIKSPETAEMMREQ